MHRPLFRSKLYDLGRAYGRRTLLILACVAVGSSAGLAQIDYRPTPRPAGGAADRAWLRDGAPIPFAGDLYYPAGPTIYFDGNTMVPSGEYDGVTLYTDTTVAPYSVLLVPVTDGILQPYQPRPSTETASAMRLPRYREGAWEQEPPEAYGQEYGPPQAWGRRRFPAAHDPESEVRSPKSDVDFGHRTSDIGPFHLETVRKPEGNTGIWLEFEGHRWQQVGEATRLDPARLVPVGDYVGFPVYADPREAYIIYLPTRGNLVAPFRRVQR